MNARDVLNKLKWHDEFDISKSVIFYVHRGAPGDEMSIAGDEIKGMGTSFFHTEEASIPYHRVFRVEYDGQTIFERAKE